LGCGDAGSRLDRKRGAATRSAWFSGLAIGISGVGAQGKRSRHMPDGMPVTSLAAIQQGTLVGLAVPLLGVRRRRLGPGQNRPDLRQLGVDGKEILLLLGHLFFHVTGLGRTLGYAQRTVDALLRVDD